MVDVTNFIGPYVVRQLTEADHQVTVFHQARRGSIRAGFRLVERLASFPDYNTLDFEKPGS